MSSKDSVTLETPAAHKLDIPLASRITWDRPCEQIPFNLNLGRNLKMKRISLTELVNEVSEATGMSSNDLTIIVDMLFSKIKEHMLAGDSVLIWRFGVFSIKRTGPRKAHDVNSNKIVTKPSKIYPKLEFSRQFKQKF